MSILDFLNLFIPMFEAVYTIFRLFRDPSGLYFVKGSIVLMPLVNNH